MKKKQLVIPSENDIKKHIKTFLDEFQKLDETSFNLERSKVYTTSYEKIIQSFSRNIKPWLLSHSDGIPTQDVMKKLFQEVIYDSFSQESVEAVFGKLMTFNKGIISNRKNNILFLMLALEDDRIQILKSAYEWQLILGTYDKNYFDQYNEEAKQIFKNMEVLYYLHLVNENNIGFSHQKQTPDVIDLLKQSAKILHEYGIESSIPYIGNVCLMALEKFKNNKEDSTNLLNVMLGDYGILYNAPRADKVKIVQTFLNNHHFLKNSSFNFSAVLDRANLTLSELLTVKQTVKQNRKNSNLTILYDAIIKKIKNDELKNDDLLLDQTINLLNLLPLHGEKLGNKKEECNLQIIKKLSAENGQYVPYYFMQLNKQKSQESFEYLLQNILPKTEQTTRDKMFDVLLKYKNQKLLYEVIADRCVQGDDISKWTPESKEEVIEVLKILSTKMKDKKGITNDQLSKALENLVKKIPQQVDHLNSQQLPRSDISLSLAKLLRSSSEGREFFNNNLECSEAYNQAKTSLGDDISNFKKAVEDGVFQHLTQEQQKEIFQNQRQQFLKSAYPNGGVSQDNEIANALYNLANQNEGKLKQSLINAICDTTGQVEYHQIPKMSCLISYIRGEQNENGIGEMLTKNELVAGQETQQKNGIVSAKNLAPYVLYNSLASADKELGVVPVLNNILQKLEQDINSGAILDRNKNVTKNSSNILDDKENKLLQQLLKNTERLLRDDNEQKAARRFFWAKADANALNKRIDKTNKMIEKLIEKMNTTTNKNVDGGVKNMITKLQENNVILKRGIVYAIRNKKNQSLGNNI